MPVRQPLSSSQAPSQSSSLALHVSAGGEQLGAHKSLQSWLPVVPQLVMQLVLALQLTARSQPLASLPSQSAKPESQLATRQPLETQAAPAWMRTQLRPQPPQFASSLAVSTQWSVQ